MRSELELSEVAGGEPGYFDEKAVAGLVGEEPASTNSFYGRIGKRLLDISVAAPALVLLAPFFTLCGLAIKLSSRGPVFFRQKRVGLGGRLFRIVKFRTMVENADQQRPSITAAGDPRVTPVGRVLRRLKVDELPQLWNVLVGEMSLVGPRPELLEFVQTYTPQQRRVLSVRPGITDPASVEYRAEEKMLAKGASPEGFYRQQILPRKLALNATYISRISLASDCHLILKSLGVVLLPGLFQRKP